MGSPEPQSLGAPPSLGAEKKPLAAPVASSPVTENLLELIWSAVWTAFFAALVTTTYHDLRIAKEGFDVEQIPAVFD